jgi:hypothetical protein
MDSSNSVLQVSFPRRQRRDPKGHPSFACRWPIGDHGGLCVRSQPYFLTRLTNLLENLVASRGWRTWFLFEAPGDWSQSLLATGVRGAPEEPCRASWVLFWQMREMGTLCRQKEEIRRLLMVDAMWCPPGASDFQGMFSESQCDIAVDTLVVADALHAVRCEWLLLLEAPQQTEESDSRDELSLEDVKCMAGRPGKDKAAEATFKRLLLLTERYPQLKRLPWAKLSTLTDVVQVFDFFLVARLVGSLSRAPRMRLSLRCWQNSLLHV